MTATPDFIRDSARLSDVFAFAAQVHEGPRSQRDTDVDHPLEVARILHRHRYDEDVIAAALLHDAVEDTSAGVGEIARRFGVPVARLVAIMTEDAGIEPYAARKAEHRRRIVGAGERAAAIFAADKLAKLSQLRRTGQAAPAEKLDHYQQSVGMCRARYPGLPFLEDLVGELAGYREALGGVGAASGARA